MIVLNHFLAQGSPTVLVSSFLELVGIGLILASIVSGGIWITQRGSSNSSSYLVRIARNTMIGSIMFFLICVGLWIVIAESYPTHAWRKQIRSLTLIAVDASSNQPLYSSIENESDVEDPYFEFSAWLSENRQWQIKWNADIDLSVSAKGYETQKVRLNASTQNPVTVKLKPQ